MKKPKNETKDEKISIIYFLFNKLENKNPAAATAAPTTANPTNPSVRTLSSINLFKLLDCGLVGSEWSKESLYLRASAY